MFLFFPLRPQAEHERLTQAKRAIVSDEVHGRKSAREQNMNTAGQIAVTLAALIGFGRLFLADEGDSHRERLSHSRRPRGQDRALDLSEALRALGVTRRNNLSESTLLSRIWDGANCWSEGARVRAKPGLGCYRL
jgi:hypothetical protein